ncbi:MarR family transcriptional regulator [Salibacterium aidingense]|uniref:MarR family transcriptional regulator n=1 Tax=Salibacterium aidingense TaxID=384933 RepID=UPI00047A9B43
MYITSIADHLQLERPTVSNSLTIMEKNGYIQRLRGQERLSLDVHLTEKGRMKMNNKGKPYLYIY